MTENLTECRLGLSDAVWQETVLRVCRNHPITELLQEDPYTRRAIEKPRGYSGDAVTKICSPFGKQIFQAVTASTNGASVRWRRWHIAELINGLAQHHASLDVLSVACGHCREGLLLNRETRARIRIAIDQDPESLAVVDRTFGDAITSCRMSANKLVTTQDLEGFDFIYSAGLFDYLDDASAIVLTQALLDKAKPGGMLLLANFTKDNWGRGYMEAFMNWQLVLRTRNDMSKLVPTRQVAGSYLYFDPYRNVVYIQIMKSDY